MIQTQFFKKLAITGITAFGVATLIMPQKANAGKANASVFTQFDLRFDINGVFNNVSAIFDASSIDGLVMADVDNEQKTDQFNVTCPNSQEAVAQVVSVSGFAQGNSKGECNGNLILENIAIANSEPLIFRRRTFSEANALTEFEGRITPTENVNLSIDGLLIFRAEVSINGWNPPEIKIATANLSTFIEIENNTTGVRNEIFEFSPPDVGIINENSSPSVSGGTVIAENVDLVADNQYKIHISSSIGAFTEAIQEVPEPTSTVSLLALGTLGAASTIKRKLKPSQSTEKETTKVG